MAGFDIGQQLQKDLYEEYPDLEDSRLLYGIGTGSIALYDSEYVNSKKKEGIIFIFDATKDISLSYRSHITQRVTESLEYVGSHIANEPPKFELTGLIGEFVFKNDNPFSAFIDSASAQLDNLSSFLPSKVSGELEKIANIKDNARFIVEGGISRLNRGINLGKSIYDTIKGEAGLYKKIDSTNQSKAKEKLANFRGRALTLETPFGKFNNMFIETISITQPQYTAYVSNVKLTVKQIKQADEVKVVKLKVKRADKLTNQNAKPVETIGECVPIDGVAVNGIFDKSYALVQPPFSIFVP